VTPVTVVTPFRAQEEVEENHLTPTPQVRPSGEIRMIDFHPLVAHNSMTMASDSENPYAPAESAQKRGRVSAHSPQVTPPMPVALLRTESFSQVLRLAYTPCSRSYSLTRVVSENQ
jgi:hypothetical protein